MFIPDPAFFYPGSRIRTVYIPDPGKNLRLMDLYQTLDLVIYFSDLQDGGFKIFLVLLFDASFTNFFKDKKSERSHKTIFLLDDRRIRIRTSY
jgi:hypothetical protein